MKSARPRRRTLAARRGGVLLLVAMLLFVFLPLMAYVLQSGLLSLTRTQMQAGADLAARETLRRRDDPSLPPADRDERRREDAVAAVDALFDDDLEPASDLLRLGAGPTVEFDGGTILPGGLVVGRRIVGLGTYHPAEDPNDGRPMLQTNPDDEVEGDIVSGVYVDAAASHEEQSEYTRDDFLDGDAAATAVLARMRRTGETQIPGGSSGPRVPFLFGRGPWGGPGVAGPGETDFMTFARRGTPVRATSIADAVPAWTVGFVPRSGPTMIGLADFVIDAGAWSDGSRWVAMEDPTFGEAESMEVEFDGVVIRVGLVRVGAFASPVAGSAARPVTIGSAFSVLASPPSTNFDPAYVAISNKNETSGSLRAAGFGRVRVATTTEAGVTTIRIVRDLDAIASDNASAASLMTPLTDADADARSEILNAMDVFRGLIAADAARLDESPPMPKTLLHAVAQRRAID